MPTARRLADGFVAWTRTGPFDQADSSPDPVPPLRRYGVCAVTGVVGALMLFWSLRIEPGNPTFYPATALLALTWMLGARASGPITPGERWRTGDHLVRRAGRAIAIGTVLLGVFLLGAVLVAQVPFLTGPVQELLDHSRRGALPLIALTTALNGVGEECYFRGALFTALPRRWVVLASTVVYAVVTALSGIPLLVLAATLVGTVVALQRRATGGVLEPTITHLTWSLGMLLLLGPTLNSAARLLGAG